MNFSFDTQALHSFSFLIFRKTFLSHNLEMLHLSTVTFFTYQTLDLTGLSCTQQYLTTCKRLIQFFRYFVVM